MCSGTMNNMQRTRMAASCPRSIRHLKSHEAQRGKGSVMEGMEDGGCEGLEGPGWSTRGSAGLQGADPGHAVRMPLPARAAGHRWLQGQASEKEGAWSWEGG